MCRTHRLPHAADGGRSPAGRDLRLRRRGPPRHAGGPLRRPGGLRLHPAAATSPRSTSPARSERRWAGSSDAVPPEPLDAALIFALVGPLVPQALQVVRKGGIVVCGGIHMSDISAFPYRWLWGERVIRSVANLTRQDGREFRDLAGRAAIRSTTTTFPLSQASEALSHSPRRKARRRAVLSSPVKSRGQVPPVSIRVREGLRRSLGPIQALPPRATTPSEPPLMEPMIESSKRPEAYDHPVDSIELLRDPHLVGPADREYAYKLKKPVDFGFVNFTTLRRPAAVLRRGSPPQSPSRRRPVP